MERLTHSPEDPERLSLTDAQAASLEALRVRYQVEYNPDHYRVAPPDDTIVPGYALGWVGGVETTIYVGVDPEGRINS
ncbi:hypothetical protein [Rhodococcus aetherivorans]|uniref:hypothetical protein n=1 Tax=Rhodococcus aetherivorans TaxID=191292 RepID=UPI0038902111